MSTSAVLFMAMSWSIVLSVTAWAFVQVTRRPPPGPGDGTADR